MNALEHAIRIVGSETMLAEAIGVSKQAVNHWKLGRRPISPERCIAIERATAGEVTRGELRPDIFGQAPGRPIRGTSP
jgi:DNA-binding transcriptional regulator YdaS (Cro superfamily)